MNAIVDTNVVAHYLLATELFVDETRQFWRAVSQPLAPAIWAAELANVIWMAIRMSWRRDSRGRVNPWSLRRMMSESTIISDLNSEHGPGRS